MNHKIVFLLLIVFTILIGISYVNNKSISGNLIKEHGDFSSGEEQIIIPVKAHIIIDDSGFYASFRSEENIINTVNEANRIWSQAKISFQIEETVVTEVTVNAIPNAINGNYLELYNNENYDSNKINIFFTQSLNNINGLALVSLDSALVADFTTVNDYRTTAHELGHLLDLSHVPESNRLMARGRNGEKLEDYEVDIARKNALKLV